MASESVSPRIVEVASARQGSILEAARTLFDEHPADVLAAIEAGSRRLGDLAELLKTVERIAAGAMTDDCRQIKALASLGASAADDMSNFLDERRGHCQRAMEALS